MSYSQIAQMELMNAINSINSESDLNEFKDLLARFFASKAYVRVVQPIYRTNKSSATHTHIKKGFPRGKLFSVNLQCIGKRLSETKTILNDKKTKDLGGMGDNREKSSNFAG